MFPPIMDDYSSPQPARPTVPFGGMFNQPQQSPRPEDDEDESPIWLMFKKRAEREMNQKMQQLGQQTPQDLYQEKIDDIRSSKGSLATHLLSDLFGALSGSAKFVPTQQRLQEQAMKEYALQTARMGQVASQERAQNMQDRLVQMQGQFEARMKQDQEREAGRMALMQDRNRVAELSVLMRGMKSPEERAKTQAQIDEIEARTALMQRKLGVSEIEDFGARYATTIKILRRQYEEAGVKNIDNDKLSQEATSIVDEQLRKGKQGLTRGLIPYEKSSQSEQVVNTGIGFKAIPKYRHETYTPALSGALENMFAPSRYQEMSRQGPGTPDTPQPTMQSLFGGTSQQPQTPSRPGTQGPTSGQPSPVPSGARTQPSVRRPDRYEARVVFDPETGDILEHFSGEEEKIYRYAATLVPAVNDIVSRVADEFISGNIDNWSGMIRGTQTARKVREKVGRRGPLADLVSPAAGRLSNMEQFISTWRESNEAKLLYDWTGAASSIPEQERVHRFLNLDPARDPEAFFTGALTTGVIMLMEHLRKTDHGMWGNVGILKELDEELTRLTDDMYDYKERKGEYKNMDEERRQKYAQILSNAANPNEVLNRIMRKKGLPVVDFSKTFRRGM